MRAGFLAMAIETWNRRLKISSPSSRARWSSSSALMSRSLPFPFMARSSPLLALDELGADRQLLAGQPEGVPGHRLGCPLHLVENAPRLHHGHPVLRVAFPLAHARLRRLLGERLVGEDADPDLPAPLDGARQGHPARLQLAVGQPARLHRLQAVVAEGQGRPPQGHPLHPAALGLAVFDPLGLKHRSGLSGPYPSSAARAAGRTSPLKTQTFTPIVPYVV